MNNNKQTTTETQTEKQN